MPSTGLLSSDTIVALATGQGGAIALVRLSGPAAKEIALSLFSSQKKQYLATPRQNYFGTIYREDTPLDEVVVTYYAAPASYTGEDVVEISCHASPYIIDTLLRLLIERGARLAEPGEFTRRSFLNGKRDLAEAEAIADLIAAESRTQHDLAFSQIKGNFSRELNALRDELIRFAALVELELDFSEEDVEFADRQELVSLLHEVRQHLSRLIASFDSGQRIKHGISVAIVGAPNAGKSTLLNALLKENRAIVSPIAGTTRDTISERLMIGGKLFRLIDTAGIRQTDDPIEQQGVERSQQAIDTADVVLRLIPCDSLLAEPIRAKEKEIIVLTKKDLLTPEEEPSIMNRILSTTTSCSCIAISAKEDQGLSSLLSSLSQYAEHLIPKAGAIVTNQRHYQLLKQADTALERVERALEQGYSGDLFTFDLRQATDALGEITGQTIRDSHILHHIFQHFCIGK